MIIILAKAAPGRHSHWCRRGCKSCTLYTAKISILIYQYQYQMLVKKYLPGIMTHGRDHVPEHLANCGFDFLSIIEQVFLTQIWVSSNAGLDIYLVNWRQVGWPERPHSEQPEKETLWNEISTADNCLAKINNIRPMSSSGPSPVFLLWLASPRQKSQYLVVST